MVIKPSSKTITIILLILIMLLAGFLFWRVGKGGSGDAARETVAAYEDETDTASIFVKQLSLQLELLDSFIGQLADLEKAGSSYNNAVSIDLGKELTGKQLARFLTDFNDFYQETAKENKKFAGQGEFFAAFVEGKKWKDEEMIFVMQKMIYLFSTINVATLKETIVPSLEQHRTDLLESELQDTDKEELAAKINSILQRLKGLGGGKVGDVEKKLIEENDMRIRQMFVNLPLLFENPENMR